METASIPAKITADITANILVVEDESIIALDIETSLRQAGYGITGTVARGEDAIAIVEHQRPDLVLMDIRLQGALDGVETADCLKQQYQLPVVFLTAHADPSTLARAKAIQPFGYLIKPFVDQELVTTVEIALARYQAESAIREALRKQQEYSELKNRFLSVVSHEFRNPLNSILFSSELLHRYGRELTDDRQATYLSRIQDSVKRMTTLLDEVLAIGETESGQFQFYPQFMDLSQFCQVLVEELQPQDSPHCPIQFTYQGGDDPLFYLDERLLRHILSNLLSNAIKYSPSGVSIFFNVACNSREVTFRIQDQGIGIPLVDQSKLFHEFHRASNVRRIPGTGLGLSIVKQCVELHGGEIQFTSEVGKGSTFIVTLPLIKRVCHQYDEEKCENHSRD
ncbi:MAG: ATP-binding protein [Synechococcales bacterium]|nr:ATP-binding protein [Synechococcales bacterium]